ncbi:MAG: porin family protein [Alphaproteobacteria bacterium]|nr:porin family protein [Alphaproteobacteria bacterium]
MKINLKLLFTFFALSTYSQASWNPYVGIGFGLSKSQNTFKAYLKNNIGENSLILNMDTTGWNESLILGTRNQQPNFFFSSELFTTLHQYHIKRKGNSFYDPNIGVNLPFGIADFEVSQKYSNGMSFLFGKDLTKTIDVFLKFDFFVSQFRIKYVNSKSPGTSGQENKWLFGYAPGVGMQFKLTDSLATRVDYTYRIYNNFQSKNISQETDVPNTVFTGKILPRIHQFTVSLIYKF